jgi:indolepyruvate ferredoxin oxidoreductase alpha subunit
MRDAFTLSEELGLPVVVRITRALALAEAEVQTPSQAASDTVPPSFQREFNRWVVLPIDVVPFHRRLTEKLRVVQARFEGSGLNGVQGDGMQGVIAAGFTYQKLLDVLDGTIPSGLRILRLGTHYPLPAPRLSAFLKQVESVLVLEETAPLTERALRAIAQGSGLTLPVYGRDTDHVPQTGELFAHEIASALNRFIPGLIPLIADQQGRPRPSREPLCDGCPYIPTFDALEAAMAQRGGRDAFIVVGDPGCMVRAQMPPYQLMDVKHGLGSAIGMATGIALTPTDKRIVALCGDSGFLHSGLSGLLDAARSGVRMLVVILDNGTTALSGGQPHPGSHTDARGRPRRAVDLAALARVAGAKTVKLVDLDAGQDVHPPIASGLDTDGLAVVIARGRCVKTPAG